MGLCSQVAKWKREEKARQEAIKKGEDPSLLPDSFANKKRQEIARSRKAEVLAQIKGLRLFPNQYSRLMKEQQSVCAICKQPESVLHKKTKQPIALAVDHCHTTNKIRGLLCSKCNMGLGLFYDNIELFESAIDYLIHHKRADKLS